jgi:hypothetical protein
MAAEMDAVKAAAKVVAVAVDAMRHRAGKVRAKAAADAVAEARAAVKVSAVSATARRGR